MTGAAPRVVRRIPEGQDAFTDFIGEVEPPLRHALVARLGRQRGDLATAEALSWAWEHWHQVQAVERPVPYLCKVGTSRTRWRRRTPIAEEAETTRIPDFEPSLDRVLRALPDRQRGCVVLVAGFGYSLAEAAELLNIRKSTAQRHYERGLARLRDQLGATEETA